MLRVTDDFEDSMSAGAADDLLATLGKQKFSTVLADPPWQFQNCTGKR